MERGGYTVATTYASSYNIHRLGKLSKAQLQWETRPTGKFQKTIFQSLKSCFFDFPLQTPLRAGSELFRCFSSCPKRNCNGRPFQLANFKKQLFRAFQSLKSCFFDFPLQTPLRAGSELFRCFSRCPKHNCNGRPFQLANFLIFPSRHPWEQAVSFSGAFPAAQSAIAMGDHSNWQISKKLFFDLLLQTTLRAGSELFRCFSSCPKRNCNGRPFQLANFKKNNFGKFSGPEKLFFWFSPPENFQGSGKLCHRPTPGLNPPGPTKTERTPNLDGTRRGNKLGI